MKPELLMKAFVIAAILLFAIGCEGKKPPEPLDLRRPGKVCELHGVPLQDDTVGVEYGYPDKEYLRAEAELFPHAEAKVIGGCVVEDQKQARVSFCPECRKARLEWYKTR
jgi:hypothetical protein